MVIERPLLGIWRRRRTVKRGTTAVAAAAAVARHYQRKWRYWPLKAIVWAAIFAIVMK